ncbi:hypothetical protein CAI21_21320 [Alkalilimnicola ehrlichii]|uniref:ankyrin repeat domain-containing protein n=1 Tax=Alkalilimnicola ehrlichii TaxID=351052 RepID=UPI000E2F0C74|nr:ankyrin repeat domain-containing protein [Alkalilimnicola ehrlichii]RFA24533.1 hypothetical protein CAI21_21320 [Alkalilimnicola ehrlichii]
MQAIIEGKNDFVRALLTAGVDPNSTNKHGHGVMGVAITTGNDEAVRLLVEAGADFRNPTTQSFFGRSVLDHAILTQNKLDDKTILLLLEEGVPFSHSTPGEFSMFCQVAWFGSYRLFLAFVEHIGGAGLSIDSSPRSPSAHWRGKRTLWSGCERYVTRTYLNTT